MANEKFFDLIFPGDFWSEVGDGLATDEHSMFGDAPVFDWLISTLRPSEIVEVGTWKGHSANYMADQCKADGLSARLVCVDTFLGGPEHWLLPGWITDLHRKNGRPTIYELFLGNVVNRKNTKYIFPLTCDSATGAEILRVLEYKADLIYIDAGHAPELVRRDILGYYGALNSGGVMFGDDYQYEPLASTVHECAKELGVHVLVYNHKWIYADSAMIQKLTISGMQIRSSYIGYVES